jgi:hypothetical protein
VAPPRSRKAGENEEETLPLILKNIISAASEGIFDSAKP